MNMQQRMLSPPVVLVWLALLGQTSSVGINLVKGGKVTQSSVNSGAIPERAIDGNSANNWGENSCAQTKNDLNPWWRLDLQQSCTISTVTITKRNNCCPETIKGAEIRIGDSLKDNGNSNPRCAVISTMQPWTTKSFQCDGMKGRYVNIVIPGRQEYLTVCEVEVIGRPPAVNIALGKKVTQSSVYLGGVPERAIDGNYASNLEEKSCSQTQKQLNPWWRLDLLKPYKIMTVSITNRGDCCAERLNEAEIRIGNSLVNNGNNNPRCDVVYVPAGTSKTFMCNGMEGQYVNIVIPGREEYLTLCEVVVFERE